jgi:hypothetical protein
MPSRAQTTKIEAEIKTMEAALSDLKALWLGNRRRRFDFDSDLIADFERHASAGFCLQVILDSDLTMRAGNPSNRNLRSI